MKRILLTGSTDGIGKIAALKLATDGHHMYIHGKNPDKLNKVISELKEQSRNENIEGLVADFSDLEEVKNMALTLNEKTSSLDIVINNAGIFKTSNPITKDGMDIRMVVNYLAPYILTHGIIDLIKAGNNSRIINLSSAAQGSVSEDLLRGKIKTSDQEAYAQSKLAILMWSFDLSMIEPELCVIALNPGSLLNTKMVQEAYGRFWSSADKGADIIYDLASSDEYLTESGKYFDNDQGQFGPAHPDAYEVGKISELISWTKDIVNSYNQL